MTRTDVLDLVGIALLVALVAVSWLAIDDHQRLDRLEARVGKVETELAGYE